MKVKSESEVAQSCLTLSDPMDYSPSGSSIHGIFQARVLECGAIAFSSVLKSRDITLPTKVCLVKAVVFPVVLYRCESWRRLSAEELMLLYRGIEIRQAVPSDWGPHLGVSQKRGAPVPKRGI